MGASRIKSTQKRPQRFAALLETRGTRSAAQADRAHRPPPRAASPPRLDLWPRQQRPRSLERLRQPGVLQPGRLDRLRLVRQDLRGISNVSSTDS